MDYPYINFLKDIQHDQNDPLHVEVVGVRDCFESHKFGAEYYGLITIKRKMQVTPGLCVWCNVKLTTKGRWVLFRDSYQYTIPKPSFIKRVWNWLERKYVESFL